LFASAVAFVLSLCLFFLVVSGNISLYSKHGHFVMLASGEWLERVIYFNPSVRLFCLRILGIFLGTEARKAVKSALFYSAYLCSEITRIILFVRSLQLSYMVALTLAE
jgi:hypothetical protein